MPIKIANGLPARKTLESENIFVMDENRATTQDIRPLKIIILNLMPTKITTETQLARLLGQHAAPDRGGTAGHEHQSAQTHIQGTYAYFL